MKNNRNPRFFPKIGFQKIVLLLLVCIIFILVIEGAYYFYLVNKKAPGFKIVKKRVDNLIDDNEKNEEKLSKEIAGEARIEVLTGVIQEIKGNGLIIATRDGAIVKLTTLNETTIFLPRVKKINISEGEFPVFSRKEKLVETEEGSFDDLKIGDYIQTVVLNEINQKDYETKKIIKMVWEEP